MIRQQENVTQEDIWAMIAHTFDQVAGIMAAGQAAVPSSLLRPIAAPSQLGPTVGEAIGTYIADKKRDWTTKTLTSNSRKLSYLREHLGSELALNSVTADDIRAFRDALCRMRVSRGKRHAQSFAARQTTSEDHRIDPKTASLTFEAIKAFFRWCKADQGYLAVNPAADIRMSLPRNAKRKKSRRPFNEEELGKLFSSPVFTGSLSRHRRFERGELVIRDAKFWLPVLGYYTGARLGELVQLHMSDVHLSGPIPYLEISEERTGRPGSEDAKRVKSQAGIRLVPLHPDLTDLGLEAFVESRRRTRRSSKRLFHEVNFGSDGQASTVFSKFFARLLDKVGLHDPALVFHSFRHGAEDAFRNALQPQYVIDRIIGHSDGSTSSGYGQGVSLEVAHQAVLNMKFPLRLPQLMGCERSDGQSRRSACGINCIHQPVAPVSAGEASTHA